MTIRTDKLSRGLRRLDPVMPGELSSSLESSHASDLLERILSPDLEGADRPQQADDLRRRRRLPKLVLTASAGVAVAVVAVLVGLPGHGGGDRLGRALNQAAAAASSQAAPTADLPYTYLKTREVSVETGDVAKRPWSVYQLATRQEWVAWNGSGRMRVVTDPSQFVDQGERAEWEAAGSPNFLALGFGGRTEDHWLATGLLRGSLEELPTAAAALATHLRFEAEGEHGEAPAPAATLQLIAEDLRDPAASPALRGALYEAARRVPGIEYLGTKTDPEGRKGLAVGVPTAYAGAPALYSLIFDPDSAKVLATETTSRADSGQAPWLLSALVYLESQGIESISEDGGRWLTGFEPAASCWQSPTPFLVYRVTVRDPCPATLYADFDETGGAR